MRYLTTTALTMAVVLASSGMTQAADDEVYAPPSPTELKAKALKWAAEAKPEPAVQKEVAAIWADVDDSLSPRAAFRKLIDTFAAVRPDAREFIESCRLVDVPLVAPKGDVLQQTDDDTFYAANMQLYYGRYLAQRRMYDEALEVLKELAPNTVADPATCLFYKAVCEHQLLMKKEGLATIGQLLKSTEEVPVSYSNVATLMRYELQEMKNGVSLKKISLKMRDSERRLDLARGGQRVQKLQGEIVADLDELIEKLEQQGGGGQCACQGGKTGRGKKTSSSPANDSKILGGKGKGEVDPKNIKQERKEWGNLPQKKIAAAKDALKRKLPPQYQRLIEAYNKAKARRKIKADE